MFCTRCGTKLADGSLQCQSCGAKQTPRVARYIGSDPEKPPIDPLNQPWEPEPWVPTIPEPEPVEPAFIPPVPVVTEAEPDPVEPAKPEVDVPVAEGAEKKKKKLMPALLIAALAVVLIGAVVILLNCLKGGDGIQNADAVVCYDGERLYIADGDAEMPLLPVTIGDSNAADFAAFSPDGVYVYFFTADGGSLYRAEISKLGTDAEKNAQAMDLLGYNMVCGLDFLPDGTFLCASTDGTLHYYDGKKLTGIAFDCERYDHDATRLVYRDQNGILYGVDLTGDLRSNPLTGKTMQTANLSDPDHVLYTEEQSDGTENIYQVDFTGKSQLLAADAEILANENGALYFRTRNHNDLRAYDCVQDDLLTEDNTKHEPKQEEYYINHYAPCKKKKLTPADYGQLYTSVTKSLWWFGENRNTYHYSMQEAMEAYAGRDNGIANGAKNFYEKYKDQENADGMIPVTETMIEELKAFNDLDISEPATSQKHLERWICLCFYVESAEGDEEAYQAAVAAYEPVRRRQQLRETINQAETRATFSLYCFSNGTLSTVAEDMVSYQFMDGCLLFNRAADLARSVPIDQLENAADVKAIFDLNLGAKNHVLRFGSTGADSMEGSAAETYERVMQADGTAFATGSGLFLLSGDQTLYAAELDGTSVAGFQVLAQKAQILGMADALYYTIPAENGENADLYRALGAEATFIAQNILPAAVRVYADNAVAAFTAADELTVISADGTKTVIPAVVNTYCRTGEDRVVFTNPDGTFACEGNKVTKLSDFTTLIGTVTHMELTTELN